MYSERYQTPIACAIYYTYILFKKLLKSLNLFKHFHFLFYNLEYTLNGRLLRKHYLVQNKHNKSFVKIKGPPRAKSINIIILVEYRVFYIHIDKLCHVNKSKEINVINNIKTKPCVCETFNRKA